MHCTYIQTDACTYAQTNTRTDAANAQTDTAAITGAATASNIPSFYPICSNSRINTTSI